MADSIVIENATIFDSTGKEAYGPGTLVIEGDRIKAVGPSSQVSAPREATVIDGTGKTILPGLIDAHAHVALTDWDFSGDPDRNHPGAVYAYSVARIIEDTLMHGFTTVRDLGATPEEIFALRDAIAKGWVNGPRIIASGSMVAATGGHGDGDGFGVNAAVAIIKSKRK